MIFTRLIEANAAEGNDKMATLPLIYLALCQTTKD